MPSVASALKAYSLAIGLALAGAYQPARGADASPPAEADARRPAEPKEGWIITVRAIGIVSPSFPGAARLRPFPFPSISFRRAGEPEAFSAPDDGFGLNVVDLGLFHAGPVANFVSKRGQRDGLFGLHSVPLTHEIGGFAEFLPNEHIRTRAELRQGVDGHRGFVAALGADLHDSNGPLTLSIGPRLNFGTNRYANAYFSVTPLEAVLNGRLAPYEATGGFTSAGGIATVRYDFTENANATVFGGLQRLTGSVASSPIPNVIGSRNQFTAGLSIGRSFEIGGFW